MIEMQQAGRLQSPAMPEHYARVELAGRGAVARLPYQVGLRSRHPILVPSVPGNHSAPRHHS